MDKYKQEIYPEERFSVFEINNVWFAVDILKSKEVIPLPIITPVPNTEDFVLGVFNLRGDIFSIVEISAILEMQPKPIKSSDMVIVLESSNITLGILVDKIHGVRTLNSSQIKTARGVVSKKMEEFITGIIPDKSSEIYLLDVERLFSSQAIRTYY